MLICHLLIFTIAGMILGIIYLIKLYKKNLTPGTIFDVLNPITSNVFGFNINRRTSENIKNAGFNIIEERMLLGTVFRLIKARPI